MPEKNPDQTVAQYLTQTGMATPGQIEAARRKQAQTAVRGAPPTLGQTLVQQGVITAVQWESVEKKLRQQQSELTQAVPVLGRYRLLRKLGEGGMGAVYLAEDTEARGKVALKVLPARLSENAEYLSRFRREAKSAFKLNHPNVVTAFSIEEDQGQHYYVMEYCEGESLDHLLKREKALPFQRALELVLQVARGLKHAHEHGIIHRDIKPANIFLSREGVAKILDLGLAKDVGDSEQSFNTQTGVALGTPHYISPEQAQGEKQVDGRTDIYSLGATLYHLITGQTPFQGPSAGAVIYKHISEQLPNPKDLRPDTPAGLVEVIAKMMAKKADDRYPSCAELIADLERILAGEQPVGAQLAEGLSSVALPGTVGRASRATADAAPLPSSQVRGASRAVAPVRRSNTPYLVAGGGLLVAGLAFAFWPTPEPAPVHSGPITVGAPADPPRPAAHLEMPPLQTVAQPEHPPAVQAPSPAAALAPETAPSFKKTSEASATPEAASGATPAAAAETPESFALECAGLTSADLLERVMTKLKAVNPGGPVVKVSERMGDDQVQELSLTGSGLKELWPLCALAGLNTLHLSGSGVTRLEPLAKLPLNSLDCSNTPLADLAPLSGMQLEKLNIGHTRVEDLEPLCSVTELRELNCEGAPIQSLAPLQNLSLTSITCKINSKEDLKVLKLITSLQTIDHQPAEQFWEKVRAAFAPPETTTVQRRPPPSSPPPTSTSDNSEEEPPPDMGDRRPPPPGRFPRRPPPPPR